MLRSARDPCYAYGMNATTSDAHTDVIAAAMRRAADAGRDTLATKADLEAGIAGLQARPMGFIAAVGGLVAAAIKLL